MLLHQVRCATLQKDLDRERAALNRLEEATEEMRGELEAAESKVAGARAMLAETEGMRREVGELRARLADAEGAREAAKVQAEALKKEVEGARAKLDSVSAASAAASAASAAAAEEQQLRRGAEEAGDAQTLRSLLAEVEARRTEAESELDKFRSAADAAAKARGRNAPLSARQLAPCCPASALTDGNPGPRSDLSLLFGSQEIDSLKAIVKEKEKEAAKATKATAKAAGSVKDGLAAAEKARDEAQAAVAGLEASLAEARADGQAWRDERDQLQQQAATAAKEAEKALRASAQAAEKAAKGEVAATEKARAEAAAKSAELEAAVAKLQSELEKLTAGREELSASVSAAKREADEANAERERMAAAVAAGERKATSLTADLQAAKAAAAEASSEAAEARKAAEKLEKVLTASQVRTRVHFCVIADRPSRASSSSPRLRRVCVSFLLLFHSPSSPYRKSSLLRRSAQRPACRNSRRRQRPLRRMRKRRRARPRIARGGGGPATVRMRSAWEPPAAHFGCAGCRFSPQRRQSRKRFAGSGLCIPIVC